MATKIASASTPLRSGQPQRFHAVFMVRNCTRAGAKANGAHATPGVRYTVVRRNFCGRRAAARALGNIQPEPKDTVPLLVKTVKNDKVLDVRLAATVALSQYGPDAREALPTLREFASEFNNKKAVEAQTIQAAIKTING